MSAFLQRIDSVPTDKNDFTFEYKSWVTNLVNTLNSDLDLLAPIAYSFSTISGTTQTADVNTTYIVGNAAQTTITLPDMAGVNSFVTIVGLGAGGWVLVPGAGQTIQVSSVPASASTSITSANQYDTISIICVVANTTWVTVSAQTTGFAIV